jgi:hypothetical protein
LFCGVIVAVTCIIESEWHLTARAPRSVVKIPHQTRYGGLQMFWLEMGVHFGNFRAGVAKELLNFVESRTRLDEPGGGRVPQAVKMQLIIQTNVPHIPLEKSLHPVTQYRTPVKGENKLVSRGF